MIYAVKVKPSLKFLPPFHACKRASLPSFHYTYYTFIECIDMDSWNREKKRKQQQQHRQQLLIAKYRRQHQYQSLRNEKWKIQTIFRIHTYLFCVCVLIATFPFFCCVCINIFHFNRSASWSSASFILSTYWHSFFC